MKLISDKEIEKFSEFNKANSAHDLIDLGRLSMQLVPKLLERLKSAEDALSHYDGDDWILFRLIAHEHFKKLKGESKDD